MEGRSGTHKALWTEHVAQLWHRLRWRCAGLSQPLRIRVQERTDASVGRSPRLLAGGFRLQGWATSFLAGLSSVFTSNVFLGFFWH